jgi:hypothetical protein
MILLNLFCVFCEEVFNSRYFSGCKSASPAVVRIERICSVKLVMGVTTITGYYQVLKTSLLS